MNFDAGKFYFIMSLTSKFGQKRTKISAISQKEFVCLYCLQLYERYFVPHQQMRKEPIAANHWHQIAILYY
jgi:hypothetical protein